MLPLLFCAVCAACASAPPPSPDPAETRRERDLAFLAEAYGCVPREDTKARRALADLLQREDRMAALRRESTVAFAGDLAALLGYRFRPADGARLAAAAEGPPARALADPEVQALLEDLRAADRLDDGAARSMFDLTPIRAAGLRDLARDPDARRRIEAFHAGFGYRFRPADATGLRTDWPVADDDAAWLAALLRRLGTKLRPTWRPQLEILIDARPFVDDLLALAAEAEVILRGRGAVWILARLADDPRPLSGADRERFHELARRAAWPNSADLLHLVPLARTEGLPELVKELDRRYDYRFDPLDGPALLRVLASGVPDVDRPEWVVRERMPLTHPGALLSKEPATAFADANDLRFMEVLAQARPELAERRRETLELRLGRRLSRVTHRFRAGAPYSETEEELPAFRIPDLLKALLLLEELDRPEVVARLVAWAGEDVADRSTELGGYVRLTTGGRLRFELVGAAAGRDDRLRLPPDPEGAALDFHFHATDEDETWWAGPSSGAPGTDLFRAEFHRTDGVVLTKLAGRRINVDLYLSTKRVLDLGVYGP